MVLLQRFVDGQREFWQIERDGADLLMVWGSDSGDGGSDHKTFASVDTAAASMEKLIAARRAEGFDPIDMSLPEDPEPEYEDTPPPPEPASSAELEDAIAADVEDVEPYLVYADWLTEKGDPRGELITVQAKLLESDDPTLAKRRDEILKTHDGLLRGNLSATPYETEWHLGFVRMLRMRPPGYDDPAVSVDAWKTVREHASYRFLRDLRIGLPSYDDGDIGDMLPQFTLGNWPHLQSLYVGDFSFPDEYEMSWTSLGHVGGIWRKCPNLLEVKLQGGSMELGTLDLPFVERFVVHTGGLIVGNINSMAQATWPRLRKLEIWFGSNWYGATGGVEDVRPILDGEHAHLEDLGLCNAEFTDELCEILPTTSVAPRIRHLDLSMGTMTDRGALALIDNVDALPRLTQLNISENYVSPDAVEALKRHWPGVLAADQDDPETDEEDRYVSVGE